MLRLCHNIQISYSLDPTTNSETINEMFGPIKETFTSLTCYFFPQQQSDRLKKIVTTQDSWIRNWLLDSVNKIEVFNFKTKWCRKLQTDIMYKFLRFLK